MLNDVYRRVTLRVLRMTATLWAMRTLVCLAVCLAALAVAPSRAAADTFLDLHGGIAIPIADNDWTDTAESSPTLGLRVGAVPNEIGGYVSGDWVPQNTDTTGGTFPGGSTEVSAHRFRLMGGVLFHHNLSNTLALTGRGGIGTDIAHASYTVNILGNSRTTSDTDAGLGFEFAGGVWFRAGSLEIGGEAAIPIGIHDHDVPNNGNGIAMHWTSVDLELLGGVRFLSH